MIIKMVILVFVISYTRSSVFEPYARNWRYYSPRYRPKTPIPNKSWKYAKDLSSVLAVSYGDNCGEGWFEYGNHCYLFRSKTSTSEGLIWNNSLSSCQSYGGNLLSISNEAENSFIVNFLNDDRLKNKLYWIGLHAPNNSRIFTWSDDTPFLFSNWQKDEPNNFYGNSEDCVETSNLGWNDNNCNSHFGFICKVNRDYINNRPEFTIAQNLTLGMLKFLKKEYTVSFDLKPISYSKGLKNVLQLSLGNNSNDRNLGVWFHEDGTGELVICSAVNGNRSYCILTTPLTLGQWYNIKISQSMLVDRYWFALDLNGVNIHKEENNDAKDYDFIKVYASNPWDDAQNGSISNLMILNQKAEYLVADVIPLVKAKIIAQIPLLDKNFLVSFDVYPNEFVAGWHSVIHFTISNDRFKYGDRIPAVLFHEDGSGRLRIAASINNIINRVFDTGPIELNKWSNIEVCQTSKSTHFDLYIYTIRINGQIVFSEINYQPESFSNVKIYASNPWYESQNGSIRNFFVINGNSDRRMKPIVIFPTDIDVQSSFISPKVYIVGDVSTLLVKGKIIAEIPKLDKEYLVSFEIFPNKFIYGDHSVIHFAIGFDNSNNGDRVLSVWFHEDGKGRLCIAALINGVVNRFFDTNPIGLKTWTNIEISQFLKGSFYVYIIRINGEMVFFDINNNAEIFNNVKVYGSNSWYQAQDCFIKNLFIINAIEMQPIIILPTDFVNHKKEINLTQGLLLGTLYKLNKEYTVSFNLKPTNYSEGLKSVLHLTLGNNSDTYGGVNLGVWFHEDGSGKLVICSDVNDNDSYCVQTTPLTLGKWHKIKISQSMEKGKYWFTVNMNKLNIHKVENTFARDFQYIKVYASNPWDDVQNGLISEILVNNGKPEYLVGNTVIPLVKGKIIAEIPKLDKEYLVSFEVYPNQFVYGYHSIIHFTIGSDVSNYGDRVPAVWFNEDGKGGLHIASAINGVVNRYFDTTPIPLSAWSNIDVFQILKGSDYVYTIRINGEVVFSEINKQPENFNNVKVYASNLWSKVQNGSIRNLFIVNGISSNGVQPVIILPKDYINDRKEFLLTQGSCIGTLHLLKKAYTLSFNLKPINYSNSLKSVLHLTLSNENEAYGDRNLGVWFNEDGSGKLVIFPAINGNHSNYFTTTSLSLHQWHNIKICQSIVGDKYWFTVYMNGVNIYKKENFAAKDFKNIIVYASNPWDEAQDGLISDLFIMNGKADYLIGNIITPLIKENMIGEMLTLDKEHFISFDINANKFDIGLHSVLHFTIGSDMINYGDRIPGVWFHEDGSGRLHIVVPIDGDTNRFIDTTPILLNMWTNIEVSQVLDKSNYVYTIKINGELVFSEINYKPQTFNDVKIYASDPWSQAQDGSIKNFFIINGDSNKEMQPVIVLPTDYINFGKELTLTQDRILGTLKILKKEYSVSFNLKLVNYSKGFKNILHLTLGNSEAYGDKSPGVWFHEDGSGKLVIYSAISGNPNYFIETTPLFMDQWYNIKIHQSMIDGQYWFAVDIDGVNIHKVENSLARDFKNMKVYASNVKETGQDGWISDLLIINGKPEYLIGNINTPILKGKVIAEMPNLGKEYLVSVDFNPKKFVSGYHNIFHFSIDFNGPHYCDRVPGIRIYQHGNGGLRIASPINGENNRIFETSPIKLNKWSKIELSQILKDFDYKYTIKLNGQVVHSEINNDAQDFNNIKVFASDPWSESQDGLIKHLVVSHFNASSMSAGRSQPNVVLSNGSHFVIGLLVGLFLLVVVVVITFIFKRRICSNIKKDKKKLTISYNHQIEVKNLLDENLSDSTTSSSVVLNNSAYDNEL
ncbi:uncharacterized protein LOC124810993 isoform X1 [Hydra vulgaris]|uniref:Uncharacterized protein LOC124810993 isoform X1 n=1 Tax=Hydra vulgaris TaxID=6087 RepID=A0ABM4CFM2_HYDVU